MPLDKELLQPKIEQIRNACIVLRELGMTTLEEFTSNYHIYSIAERYLQLSIEAVLHICSLIVATLGLRKPEGYHDLLSTLASQQFLPRPLAYRLEVLTDLRDVLLSNPNHEVLYEHVQHCVPDLEAFADTIEKID
jgi:uncharacterized protein YutE (UPF0331/DUF86 family)